MNEHFNMVRVQMAINQFAENLKVCTDMSDRKCAVMFLANVIGADHANKVACVFGLTDQYYQA